MAQNPQIPDHPPKGQLIIKLVMCMLGTCCFICISHSTLIIPHVRRASIIITLQARKWRLGEPKSVAKAPFGKWQD